MATLLDFIAQIGNLTVSDEVVQVANVSQDINVNASEWIDAARYDPIFKTLQIEVGANTYTYFNVSEKTYRDFVAAPSKGEFINNVIKQGFYPYVKD